MKVFVFDNFGVVMNELSYIWEKRHLTSDRELQERSDIGAEADRDEISADEMFRKYGKMIKQTGPEVRAEWRGTVRVNWEVIDIVKDLRKNGYKVVMFSNATSSILRDYMASFGILDEFDRIFISSEMKLIKPEPESFKYVLSEMGVRAKNAMMIDDRERNIAAAEAMGMECILFADAPTLREKLEESGYLQKEAL